MATRLVSLIRVVPVFGLVVLSLAAAGPAQASTTLTVSTTSDTNPASGPCASGTTTPPSPLSLRDAVCVANNLGGTVTISVPSGTYDLSFGELDAGINAGQNVTISGAGAASTTISGQGNSRVLNIDENLVGGIAATVSGVTITGGSDSTFGGAGIIAGSGDQSSLDTLTITNCVITGNHANLATPTETNNPGGGLQFIGGKLSITGSTFSDNSAASSPGAAVFYEAQGEGSPESFSMSGSTISGNTGANTTGSSVPTDGAVDLAAPGGGISMQVTDSVFTSNAMTGTSGPVRGAALTLEGGTASVTNSNFSGNSVTGSTSASGGGAIAVVTGTATVTNDRIVGNQAQSAAVGGGLYNDNGTVTATNDWWGCNAGPGSTGCDTVSGTVTTNPRIELTASPVTLASASTAPVTGDLNQNSAGQAVTGPQNELDGVTETFTSPLPAGATCTPGSVAFSGGTASASCTFNPNGSTGAGSVVATVDNQSITVPVTITQAPAITTQPSDVTVPAGGTATFTAAASGYPAPTVQWKVSTDGGSTYTNVSGATSPTLSFTATAGDAGNLYEAVFTNSTGTATTNPASLSEQQAPAFTSASSTTFTAGTAGTFEVTTSGFPNATLSESGSLPSGVTFTDNGNGTGTLAGTPASGAGGSYPITLTASNGVSPDATQSFTLNVSEAPSITSGASTTFVAGSAGTFTVTTTGHPAAALTESGSLPSGVTFHDNGDGTATLAGTPAGGTGGSYPITITATNSAGHSSQDFTLTVSQAPAITSADHATFDVGTAGTFTVTSTGSPAASLSESGALPSGVTFHDNGDGTATLAGTPAGGTGGSYSITITASNGTSPDATQNFTLTVAQAPSITSGDSTTFVTGSAGTFTVTTSGTPAAALTESGSLPAGVTFHDNGDGTATLAGTPAGGTGGSYPITITATNSAGHDTQNFTLTVSQAPAITSADHATFDVGAAGTFTVTSTGSPAASLSETGALPSGVTFTDNGDGTATLAGTPAPGTGGSYPITIKATNGTSPDATQSFTLNVAEAPSITSADHTTFAAGVAGSFTVTTSGAPAAALTESGALPSGVTFTDNGDGTATLAGTPAGGTAGSYPITITATNSAGHDTQSFTLTVTVASQTITFTSTPPASPVVGETYAVTATGGGSGNPVTFAIDPTSAAVCTISGATVTFTGPGACLIDAAQAGNDRYSPATGSQSVPVSKAATSTAVTVHPTTITATVAAVPPGAGTPTGSVTFSVDGGSVGTAPLSGGTATLTYTVPSGATHSVSAVYGGDSDFTGSSGSTSRQDPTITATVSSQYPKTSYGWYRSAVTVTFQCTATSAPLTGPCPSAVTFSNDGAGQSVTRTITATDGGAASVTVSGINIDTVPPTVSISGVQNGQTYTGTAPTPVCVGSDALSGLASCTLSSSQSGNEVTVTATATDEAGNTATAMVSYFVLDFYVLNAPYSNGAYQLQGGQAYTLVALVPTNTAPRFYDATPGNQQPYVPGPYFQAGGRQGSLYRFTLIVTVPRGLNPSINWNFGVQVGSTMNLIIFRPVS